MWQFFTNLGDSAIIIPVALMTYGFLFAGGEVRLAFSWALATLGCALAIVVLKLLLFACWRPLGITGPLSPSGHTAMSAAVYGSLCLFAAKQSSSVAKPLIYFAGGLLISIIASSRVVLQHHDTVEVSLGLVVGAGAMLVFGIPLSKRSTINLPGYLLTGAAALLMGLLHGTRWPAEQALHRLGGLVAFLAPWCG